MARRKTHEEFINELNIKNPNIEVLGKYINAHIKIKCKCKICGCIWDSIPNNLLRDRGCPECGKVKCSKSRTRTHEQFVNELKNINPNIIPLEKYKNVKVKIKCRCNVCRHEWNVIPDSLLRGYGCPKCGIKKCADNNRKSHDEFIKEFNEKNPNAKNIRILGKYTNINTTIKCECLLDGEIWHPRADHLLNGHGCPKCQIRNNSGENNHWWNPNLSKEDREDKRNYPEYNEWRTKCFERDKYTCQVTGQQGGKLVVHHLYSYNKYYCLRTALENGITISEEIHKKFHSIYGNGNNTFEQWEEFIKSLK
jgi:hypothetical protein